MKDSNDKLKRVRTIIAHIERVNRNCFKVGSTIIENAETPEDIVFGRMLISNGQIHDNSKLNGIEWENLFSDDPLLMDVIKHHSSTNPHHPEYWGKIQNMPEVYIAEMVCDCTARSTEFGTDVRHWFSNVATVKYNFDMDDRIGHAIDKYLNLLLEKPFKR